MTGMAVQLPRIRCSTSRICCSTSPDSVFTFRRIGRSRSSGLRTDPPFNAKRVFNAPLGSKAAGQRFDDRWRWDEVTDEWFDLIADEHRGVKEVIEAAAVIEGGEITTAGENPVLRWSGSPVQGDPAPDADGSGEEVPVARRAR